jgi:hypothetical protein
VWFRDPREIIQDMISNPDFKDEVDYSAKRVFGAAGKREWKDFMSGNWAWEQSVRFYFSLCVPNNSTNNFGTRILSLKILKLRARCLSPLSLEVTKQPSQWPLATTNITRYTFPQARYITMSGEPIAVQSQFAPSLQSLKVSCSVYNHIRNTIHVYCQLIENLAGARTSADFVASCFIHHYHPFCNPSGPE